MERPETSDSMEDLRDIFGLLGLCWVILKAMLGPKLIKIWAFTVRSRLLTIFFPKLEFFLTHRSAIAFKNGPRSCQNPAQIPYKMTIKINQVIPYNEGPKPCQVFKLHLEIISYTPLQRLLPLKWASRPFKLISTCYKMIARCLKVRGSDKILQGETKNQNVAWSCPSYQSRSWSTLMQ